MKLGAFVLVVAAVGATGCAARPAPSMATVPTSTTRLTAAEVPVGEDAPRVGKQQSSFLTDDLSAERSPAPAKDGRHGDRRTGGGFSGYK